MVVDGVEQAAFDKLLPKSICFSDDAQKLAYVGIANSKHRVVIDGHLQAEYENVTFPVIGPGSSHIAWMAQRGQQWFVVIDGVEGGQSFAAYLPGARLVFESPTQLHTVVISRPQARFYRLDVQVQSASQVSIEQ